MAATDPQTPQHSHESQYLRLPCRGCTPDCANYAVCEGAPWRIARDGTLSAPLHAPDHKGAG